MSETHQSIITHYNQSEKRILKEITKKIDQNQSEIVNNILDAIERDEISTPEINDTFGSLQKALNRLHDKKIP